MVCKVLRALIMGPPGSGKGTISSRIVKDFGLVHVSSGDLLRTHMLQKTDLGILAKSYIDQGKLVPDESMVKLLSGELEALASKSLLLDGFPRTLAQAKALHSLHPIDMVISLNVPFEVIINRVKGRWLHPASGRTYHTEFNPPKSTGVDDVTGETLIQRDDDKPETVKARLNAYQHQVEPLLQYYSSQSLLTEFYGKFSNEIWPNVHKCLAKTIVPLQYTEYR